MRLILCTENEKDAQLSGKVLERKISENFSNGQRTPEKQKEPSTLSFEMEGPKDPYLSKLIGTLNEK